MKFNPHDIEALKAWFIDAVDNQKRHKHYQHTVDLAARYKAYFTGDDQTEMIVSYKPAESKEQKTQRLRLYNSFTPHICGRIIDTYSSVESTDEIIDRIEYQDDLSAEVVTKRNALIHEASKNFYNQSGIKKFVKSNFRRLAFYDPNAFIVVEFNNDGKTAKTWPVELPSSQVFDFKYDQGVLQYLIAAMPITLRDRGKDRPGTNYILYTADHALQLTEAGDEDRPEGESIMLQNQRREFLYQYFFTGSGQTQAKRVGWIQDPSTDFTTCVSPLFKADKLLRDIINTKSEKDLAQALHGFIQKFAYAERCEFTHKEGNVIAQCDGGVLRPFDKPCPSCKGTGKKIHTSVQDIIYIKLPDSRDGEQVIPLDKFVHYVEIPQHIIEAHNADLTRLESQVMRAVFNSEAFSRDASTGAATATATEKLIELSYTYRELSVYASALAELYIFLVTQTAQFNDVGDGIQVLYEFPSNFNLESVSDLLDERRKAVDAQLPADMISTIDYKILTRMNVDSPKNVAMYVAKERHRPFRGKSDAQAALILSMMSPDQIDYVIYAYYDSIFSRIESKFGLNPFSLGYDSLQALIDKEAKRIIDERLPAPSETISNPFIDEA